MKLFIKQNLIFVFFAVLCCLFEMYGLCFTDNGMIIFQPWFSLLIMLAIIGFTALIRSYPWRVAVLSFVLAAIIGINSGFILLYDINGTSFDFTLLYQAGEGLQMLEGQLINFAYLVPCAILAVCFIFYGVFTALSMKDKNQKIYRRPRVRAVCLSLAIVFMGIAIVAPNVANSIEANDENYYENILYHNENEYKKFGITGEVLYQFVTGPFVNSRRIAEWDESSQFLFKEKVEDGELFGISKDNNVVMILAESVEWFPITANPEVSTELFPNITRLMNEGIVAQNHYSREKTDISEAQSLLGSYPLRDYTCNEYKQNAYPYALPNIYQNEYSTASVNSYHNHASTYYNRDIFHKSLGFEKLYGIEHMTEYGAVDYQNTIGERNLDSEMMTAMKDMMFPTDKPFFTYVISYTTHGGYYNERESLEKLGYYDKLDQYGVYPHTDNIYDNYIRTYAAAYLDFDKAIGIMLDDLQQKGILDKTTIVIYSDHNAYYDRMSYHGKGIDKMQSEIFRVPMFIYDTKAKEALSAQGKSGVIEKFTTTADIVPTVLNLLGIEYYSNLYFGNNVFSETESIIYSRAYSCFITDDFLGYSLKSVVYKNDEFNRADFEARAKKHLEKLKYIDAMYIRNFFKNHEFPQA